ncbi:hypothetical protein ACM01_05135 [Streptomyces viridochromogenes]|uniref:Uncharacterized protein n=1 Tax=Streptomyces viridochromogenes TaxID=1938 RepID=A0A0J7ZKP0_STRVR|nr:hypothetical protein ACM01_05135 [Streptomyces viridochromogenes]KOG23339.1 hypothetical protein ADK35_13795 [Streptomyces viridochromogenes]KOG27055.1 hypothetical protein ADK36_00270 [Streptomyces viridochromogenes]
MVIVGLVVGLALVVGCVLVVRSRRAVRWSEVEASPPAGGATDGMLTCPACAHRFKRPDIMIVTKAQVKRYGRDPVQCSRCDLIWDAGGRPHRTR